MKRSIILGACLLVFTTTISISRAAEMPDVADLIIYNAKVLTVNSNFTVASAIAVKDGRILAVGKDRKLEEYRGPGTKMVDAQGRTVMPGLYDADVSSFVAATSELKEKWPVINSIADAQAYIRMEATNKPPGAWIELNFIPPTRLAEGRLPTKEELDAATTNHPVCWNFGPVDVVNSKALEVSKIDKDTQAPSGGEIVKDPRHHKPTGLLRNAASLLKLPPAERPPTAAQERAALKHLYQLYNEQGITSIGEDATTTASINLFRDMSSSNELTVRINCGRLFHPSADADESIDRLAELTNAPAGKLPYGPTGVGDDWVKIGPLETVIDGTAGMGTAYLRTPYGIGPTYMNTELAYRGLLMENAYALPQIYLAAAQSGWQLEAHCAGDAALDFLLNSYEQVGFKLDIRQRRFLIAHPEFQAAQDWSRCQQLGVGAVVEPTSLYEDGTVLKQTLGTNRLTYYAPLKGWFDRGIVAGGASGHFQGLDSLNSPKAWNPWLGMWITQTRQTKQGDEINPHDKLTREQMVRLYTINNAWLNFEDKVKGSLEPGKLADLIMVDTDIMKCRVDEIPNAKVMFTMVDGKVVWQEIEPIFQGPQVIQSVTVNAPIQPVNVAAPITPVPVVAISHPAAAAPKHEAQPTGTINPFAPVPDEAPVPAVAATAPPAPVAITTNAAPSVAAVVEPAAVTNATTSVSTTESVPALPAMPAAPVAHANEAAPDTNASSGTFTSVAGAAPAEVALNQTPAPAPASPVPAAPAVTNQPPAATVTNQIPGVINTNAANSVIDTNQVGAVAPASPASAAPATTVQAPVATTSTTSAATDTAAASTPSATTGTTSDAPAATPSGPTQIASATTPAPPAAASATPDKSATAPTAPSTTVTNDAAGGQDWSRVGSGAK